MGDATSVFARAAEALRAERPARNPRLREAEAALRGNDLSGAREILSQFLEKRPDDPIALNLMAAAASRLSRKEEAAGLLARCLGLDPNFRAARYEYANLLLQLNKTGEALAHVEEALKSDPRNPLFRDLKSVVLSAVGEHRQALRCYSGMVEDFPESGEIWIKYAAILRGVGQRDQAVAAYRRAIELRPESGEAYWGLAGLNDYHFSQAEIEQIQQQLSRAELRGEERMYFHFALGRALGSQGQYGASFQNYVRANALKRLSIEYDPASLTRHVDSCKALMSEQFFAARSGLGSPDTAPIFILGMQRAGSTLVQQILAAHPTVEATAELPNISLLAEHIGEKIAPEYGSNYPSVLEKLDAAALRRLGDHYMESTRSHRKLGRPFFTDKMPYNFLHIGLILLILPNAKIIDARRHPLGCCFSNFAMHFKAGPLFGYRLAELGHAYGKYVELMSHVDRVLPGRIHRVFYEELVRSPEEQVRRLLEYLGLSFEQGCLEFHKKNSAMDSASAEQVRKPLYRSASDQWRNYEPWLGPLKAALGPVLEAYPGVPDFPA